MSDPSPPQPRALEVYRDALGRITLAAFREPGRSFASIPADPERDADLLLADALNELERGRAQVAELTADNAALVAKLEWAKNECFKGFLFDNPDSSELSSLELAAELHGLLAQPHPGAALLAERDALTSAARKAGGHVKAIRKCGEPACLDCQAAACEADAALDAALLAAPPKGTP